MRDDSKLEIERVQTGVRMEKRILKVLKAFAEYHDMTLGDVLEGIVLHAFDGKMPFSPASLERIRELRNVESKMSRGRNPIVEHEDLRKRVPGGPNESSGVL